MDTRFVSKSLEGLIRPVKVAPIATALTTAGIILGIDGIKNLYELNLQTHDLPETLKSFLRMGEASLGFSSFVVGLRSYYEAYTAYFRGLRNILRFERVDRRYISKYQEREATCSLLGYKAAAEILNYREDYRVTMKDLKAQI